MEAGRTGDEETEPTPGERLFYVLGQLYRLYREGELPVAPERFDILDLARIIGVHRDIEVVIETAWGVDYHLGAEVLVLTKATEFPWQLLSVDAWALWRALVDG